MNLIFFFSKFEGFLGKEQLAEFASYFCFIVHKLVQRLLLPFSVLVWTHSRTAKVSPNFSHG